MLNIPRLFLYRESSYTETLFKEESCFNILQELRLRISQKKFVQENRTKLFSHQKPELGPYYERPHDLNVKKF